MTKQRITSIAQNYIYKYMKMNDIKTHQYSYHSFFHYMTNKLDILVMEHNLHNDIAGLSIIDKHGHSSISYQKAHHPHRQNFTKCHELGHFLLEHEGSVFTFSHEQSPQESEANLFAGQILAPDIILYGKIVKDNKTFQEILKDLEISSETLKIRLTQLLSDNSTISPKTIETIIQDYLTLKNNNLKGFLEEISSKIILDYQNVKIDPLEHLEYLLEFNDIVTSLQVPELSKPSFKNKLPTHLSLQHYWGKGIEIYYCYNNQKLTAAKAKKNAKNIWFSLAY
ncbi:ImmA/IrrE family metallo-endopeptidase [Streptococcus oriscaviae]|uniref:ImmA/IrrE family metallo-endopeptidase n=1 Tax=Streptococcus oriscaviae TaxID=2781599 RepID=A0ABX7YIP0_9STRE|nr:ImmA/IrrE family metallo-endopeptidase [Streptococcus oriscaviae]QUE53573.1 ImmA/IrrE family metallo-endopeptidase [Streptococcus oriscaviae]